MKTITITISIFVAVTTSSLKAQLNQASLDLGRDVISPQGVINQTSLSYARSISGNERHLLEAGITFVQIWNEGTGGQLYGLYRYRFDYSAKWDFSTGLGFRTTDQQFGNENGYVTPTATIRYNFTRHTSLRLRALGMIGAREVFRVIPSLGLSYRWPKKDAKEE